MYRGTAPHSLVWQSCGAQKFTKIRKKSDIAKKNSYPHGLFIWNFFRIFIGWKGGSREAEEIYKALIINTLR
jgi:hypothetical protein